MWIGKFGVNGYVTRSLSWLLRCGVRWLWRCMCIRPWFSRGVLIDDATRPIMVDRGD